MARRTPDGRQDGARTTSKYEPLSPTAQEDRGPRGEDRTDEQVTLSDTISAVDEFSLREKLISLDRRSPRATWAAVGVIATLLAVHSPALIGLAVLGLVLYALW